MCFYCHIGAPILLSIMRSIFFCNFSMEDSDKGVKAEALLYRKLVNNSFKCNLTRWKWKHLRLLRMFFKPHDLKNIYFF